MLAEVAEVLAHLGGPGGAVDAHHVGAHGVEGGQGSPDLGAGQHRAGDLHGHLHLDGHLPSGGSHGPSAADDGRLGAEEVELRLDQEHVDAALQQARGLNLVGVPQLGEADLTQRRELGPGTDGSRHQPVVAVGHLAGDAGGGDVQLVGAVGDPVLGQRNGEGTEAGRLHDVDADLEELVVHGGDELRAGGDEQLIAAFEGLPAEVVRAQAQGLHVGAEGSVVDDHLLLDEVDVAAGDHGSSRLPVGLHRRRTRCATGSTGGHR